MKNLVLFTSQYPYIKGDGNFVKNEINELSSCFDKIFIIRGKKIKGVKEFELPHNVELIFEGYSNRYDILRKGLFNKQKIPFKLFIQDKSEINNIRFFFRFLMAFFLGRALSNERRIKDLLNNNSPKELSMYFFWGTGMSYIIPWLKKKKYNITVKLHRGDLYPFYSGYIPFRRYIYKQAGKLIVISKDGKNYLTNFLDEQGIPSNKIELIKLGTVDYGITEYSKSYEEKLIVTCSAISQVKRVALIHKVLVEVSKKLKIRWIHFGDGSLKNDLLNQIETLKSENLIIDLKGYTENSKIIDFYRTTKVDLFMNLSISEGIPVSIMEAISFNIPVLATNAGGTGEIVGENIGTGILISKEYEEDVIPSYILKLLLDEISFTPRDYWMEYYNSDINNKKLIQILKKI